MARERLEAQLAAERARREAAALRRELPELPLPGADFTSNDVLGLSRHPRVLAAARAALDVHGAGGRASRLLGGGSPHDAAAEAACARWLGAEAALLFPSGYHANLGLLGALAGPGDLILSDALNHASLVDAARLARARIAVYAHGDVEAAERLLRAGTGARRVLVVSESVFSMDGDLAPLAELAALCARHGAALVVDEAHACGLLGPRGAGAWAALAAARELPDVLAARVVTGGKALGVCGGFVAGSRALVEQLVDRARSFAFTTALPPAAAGALEASLALAGDADAGRARALELARRLAQRLELPAPAAAIVPVVLGDARRALDAARRLRERGLQVRAVRPPTVPEGGARLRVVCHAFNTDAELERLAAQLQALLAPRATAQAAEPALAPVLVVAGTDTGVGKTVVSALLARAALRTGAACYWKPVQTGLESDTAEVERLAGLGAGALRPPEWNLPLPASPHEAAAAAGVAIDLAQLDARLDHHRRELGAGLLIVELAGGLQVPLTDGTTQLDWLARRRLPLVLVARAGLGTLNHTLLSLEALRARHLEPRALVLVGPPHPSNRATLARLGAVQRIVELPALEQLDARVLAEWLDALDLAPLLAEHRQLDRRQRRSGP